MASRSKLAATLLAAACLLGFAGAQSASAAPAYTIWANWGDTLLAPGGAGEFTLHVRNVGDSKGSGLMTVTDKLPVGVTITGFDGIAPEWNPAGFCSGVGTRTASCSISPSSLPDAPGTKIGYLNPDPDGYMQLIFIEVAVSPSASGTGTNVASVSGGGGAPVSDTDSIGFSPTPAGFGIVPGSFESDIFDSQFPAGAPLRQAGAHPYELRVNFDTNERYGIDPVEGGPFTEPQGRVKTVKTTLPVGLIGNPEATPKCDPQLFASRGVEGNSTGCPADTQVGYLNVETSNGTRAHGWEQSITTLLKRVALYNLVPPKGVPADFGFSAAELVQGHIYPELDAAHNYAITANSPDIADLLGVRRVEATFWGVPGDPAHDNLRYFREDIHTGQALGASFGSAAIRPLLANPMDCGVDNGGSLIQAESWNEPGHLTPVQETSHLEVEGCEDQRVRFNPDVALQPTSRAAGGPTGLTVHLKVPQRNDEVQNAEELYEQNEDVQAIPIPPMKKAVVTLPEGMTLSTSAAQGLTGCTPQEIGLGTNSPVTCPDSSQYGTLTLHTPLLPPDEPMRGFIYIAQQGQNPFGTFLAMYLVIQDESRGLLVKIPGKIELDPKTGQIKTTFDDLPQFPVSDMELSLKGGVRAGLVNPPTCGEKTIKAEFFSWANPNTPVPQSSSYDVTQKPDGSPCVNDLGERPFKPQMTAGTVSSSAGSFSPFVFRLTRTDEDQEFSQLGVTLPPGLSAKLAGITECPEAGIAQAASRTAAGDGSLEQNSPSCPASSQIGTSQVGSGVGQVLTFIGGKAYLAGPYKGAPLSMVVISPIVTGPYDLGVIAVRSALEVNPETAQVTVKSDPFPQIYQGIPVRIRDIRVNVDRPETTINPTSCDPMQVQANITGTGGNLESTADDSSAELSERFQAANCASLAFNPRLSLRLKGKTSRGAHPRLQATLRMPQGSANIARAKVALPRSEFLDQGHIRTVCTRVQFQARECPKAAIYGWARATTPLLEAPLEGPVYLRSSSHQLPDLVADLNGQIEVALDGRIDSVNGGIRNSFEVVPDAPVTKFTLTMQGGAKGLLVNSTDLCAKANRASADFTAQNGKVKETEPLVQNDCAGAARKHKHRRHKAHKRAPRPAQGRRARR